MSSVVAYEWLQAPTLHIGTELQSRHEGQTFSRYLLGKESLQFCTLHLGWDFKITLPEWFFCLQWMVTEGLAKWKNKIKKKKSLIKYFLSDWEKEHTLDQFGQGPLSRWQRAAYDAFKSPQCLKSNPVGSPCSWDEVSWVIFIYRSWYPYLISQCPHKPNIWCLYRVNASYCYICSIWICFLKKKKKSEY